GAPVARPAAASGAPRGVLCAARRGGVPLPAACAPQGQPRREEQPQPRAPPAAPDFRSRPHRTLPLLRRAAVVARGISTSEGVGALVRGVARIRAAVRDEVDGLAAGVVEARHAALLVRPART